MGLGDIPDCRKWAAEYKLAGLGVAYGAGHVLCAVADGTVLCAQRQGRRCADLLDVRGGVQTDGRGVSSVSDVGAA